MFAFDCTVYKLCMLNLIPDALLFFLIQLPLCNLYHSELHAGLTMCTHVLVHTSLGHSVASCLSCLGDFIPWTTHAEVELCLFAQRHFGSSLDHAFPHFALHIAKTRPWWAK